MIPQSIPEHFESQEVFCNWLARWGLDRPFGRALQNMQAAFPTTLKIISGQRTPEHQARLRADGRPVAPDHLSTHLTCPAATGADLGTSIAADDSVKVAFGLAAAQAGLRWGGGSQVDQATGIPVDWNHVDTGARASL